MTGHTFSIKRMQTHDGPGFRTTVFMKGCSLRCEWCHNPESLSSSQEVWRDNGRCIGCRLCETSCGELTSHSNWNGDLSVVDHCPAKALESLRTDWSVSDLMFELERDADFWNDEGGVTISGGEPAVQWPFVLEILKNCKLAGWHTALDTCGIASMDAFQKMVPYCDIVLFDLKMMDSDQHQKWTGRGNEQILKSIQYIAQETIANESDLWIRTPLIPDATATEDNIEMIGHFLQHDLRNAASRWELCSFNNLCAEKYARLEQPWSFSDTPLLDKAFGETLFKIAQTFHSNVFLKGRFQ